MPKQVLNSKPEGTRRPERPKLRWKDSIAADARDIRATNWKKAALQTDVGNKKVARARSKPGVVALLMILGISR